MDFYYKVVTTKFGKKKQLYLRIYLDKNAKELYLIIPCKKGDNVLLTVEDYLKYHELDKHIKFKQLIPL